MMEASSLDTLLVRVAARDSRALRELYDATAPRLKTVALRLLRDPAAAEDVLQDVYVTLWQRGDRAPAAHTHPMAWLTAMVRNRAIDVMRRARPEVPLQWQDADGEEHHHDITDEGNTPTGLLSAVQEDARLGECIGRLEDEPRQAVLLAYYEGLTHADLAQRLGRPLGTVKAWVRRSLTRLKDCLGEMT